MRLSIRAVCLVLLLLLITPSAVHAISIYGDEKDDVILEALVADQVSVLAPDLANWELAGGGLEVWYTNVPVAAQEEVYAALLMKNQDRTELLMLHYEANEWELLVRNAAVLPADWFLDAEFVDGSLFMLSYKAPDSTIDNIFFRTSKEMEFVEGDRYLPAYDIPDDEEVRRRVYVSESREGVLTFTFYIIDPNDDLDLPDTEDEESEYRSWKEIDAAPVSISVCEGQMLTLSGFDMEAYLDTMPGFPGL